ncbi:hypothetical protein [Desulfotomaculum copahuensis]|uniref:Uncharacterized protein n=1 Tax=Desulfotomaculum copahuensis TaxID=1838280 RepID=A0A1B7LGU2_9FIRM|nr:hypothetical protein [Desulfotomaculum copahuensis]OAT85290.1 hypothetical protein A6M21_07050 [Desulfotomaculum copahuensis]
MLPSMKMKNNKEKAYQAANRISGILKKYGDQMDLADLVDVMEHLRQLVMLSGACCPDEFEVVRVS